MSAAVRLRSELQAAIELAATLMTTAETEQRELTAAERAQVDTHLAKARDLKESLARATEVASLQDDVRTMVAAHAGPAGPSKGPLVIPSWGAQWVGSAAMEFIRGGFARGGAWTTPSVELVAATLTEDPASGGKLLTPQYQPGVQALPAPPTSVLELLAQGTTDATSIVYMVEKTVTNAAAPVAEGGLKPESAMTFDSVTDAVKKIATWLPVSEEMLADVAQIQAYIDQRLRQFVLIALEQQVINGDGVGPNLLGILQRPGLAPPVARGATELNAEAIYRQIIEILATSLIMPDGVVLSPRAWAECVIAKDSTGVFYGPGMFSALPSPSLWGLPVAISTRMPAPGTGLVGNFKLAAQLWRRSQLTVQASNSHADFFIRNLVAIRAEIRAALAVYRPGAFGTVTGLSTLTAPVMDDAGSGAGNGGNGGARGALGAGDAERGGDSARTGGERAPARR